MMACTSPAGTSSVQPLEISIADSGGCGGVEMSMVKFFGLGSSFLKGRNVQVQIGEQLLAHSHSAARYAD
jgi:hypothetical protein